MRLRRAASAAHWWLFVAEVGVTLVVALCALVVEAIALTVADTVATANRDLRRHWRTRA